VPHVALDVVPVREARELAATRADEVDVLAEILRSAELDREVADDRKRTELDAAQRADVIGACELERSGIAKNLQSFDSMR
jgi:hypothetical protein